MPIEDEGRAIDEVVDRIAAKYPNLPRSIIREQVDAQLAAFAGSTVRDFVPILVEHATIELLAEFGGPE
ncbi:three-helix bundle dimerization domain-containing protein [Cellulomonas sp. P5_C6]